MTLIGMQGKMARKKYFGAVLKLSSMKAAKLFSLACARLKEST